jgi:hypothetical protein
MALVLRQPRRVYPRMPKRLPLIDQYPPYALSFDGVDDYVDCGQMPELNNTGSFTAIAWIYHTVDEYGGFLGQDWGGVRIWEMMTDTFRRAQFRIWYSEGDLRLYSAAEALPLNVWKHYVGRYDASIREMSIWIDGNKVASATIPADRVPGGTVPLHVGAVYSTSFVIHGFVAAVLIYTRALSQAEIQYLMYNPLNPIKDGLVLFLPMLEGSGTGVKDYSGLGHDGTLYNGVGWAELAKYEIPAGAML